MINVLLVGGTGIISSEICALSIQQGYSVTIINRGKRMDFVHPQTKLIIADIRKESVDHLRHKIRTLHFDVVIDFISYTPEHIHKTLEIFQHKCKQLVFVSSATVYSKDNLRYTEDSQIGNIKWKYASQKANAEKYLSKHSAKYGIAYTIIRPYVTYGKSRIPLQFAPIEYYTIINRMINKKPIAVYGKNVSCTLTTAKNFAVGAVGLFMNKKSYGEAFHITGSCETTWDNAIQTIAKAFRTEAYLLEIPEKLMKEKAEHYGLDSGEILGDKGRNMVFDNTKIRMTVPSFHGETQFNDVAHEISAYFNNNPKARKVNYSWDARMDRLISNLDGIPQELRNKLHLSAYKNVCSFKEKLLYIINRYGLFFYLLKSIKSIIKLFHEKTSCDFDFKVISKKIIH